MYLWVKICLPTTVLCYTLDYKPNTIKTCFFLQLWKTIHSIDKALLHIMYLQNLFRFNVPKFLAMIITTLQLIQMVVGCLVNIWTYQIKEDGLECQVSDNNIKLSLLMYCSYFVLFARFFYNAYLKPKNSKKRD